MGRVAWFFAAQLLLIGTATSLSQDARRVVSPSGLVVLSPEELAKYPLTPAFRDFRPERVDLSSFFPRANHQIGGTCTAWAVAYARAYYGAALDHRNLNDQANIPSPPYIHNTVKDGSPISECRAGGSAIPSAINVLSSGALSLRDYPNLSVQFCQSITPEQRAKATDFRTIKRDLVGTKQFPEEMLDKLRGELAKNNPVIIGMLATEAFALSHLNPTMYNPGKLCEPKDCAHAITVVGYDDKRQVIKIINSWGEEWGERGFGWISYSAAKQVILDAWVMSPRPPPPPPPPPPTCSLMISPATIQRGASAMLSYSSRNAHGGTIDHGIGGVWPNGSATIFPETTTTYIGTFSGDGGIATCAANVTVTKPPEPAPDIVSFKSSPDRVLKGETATLSWSVTGASRLRLDGGEIPAAGSKVVVPSETTKYTLNATNKEGVGVTATTLLTVESSSAVSLPGDRCGHIELAYQQGKKTILGFVGKLEDVEWLRNHYADAKFEVDVKPWPICEVLQTLHAPIAKGSSQGLKVSIKKPPGLSLLRDGEQLFFEIKTPSYSSYIYAAYIQADGMVANLSAIGEGLQTPRPPSSTLTFGTGGPWGRFRVSSPFGREMLIVLASKRPIFSKPHPEKETERQFLDALRTALFTDDGTQIVANYDSVVTTEK